MHETHRSDHVRSVDDIDQTEPPSDPTEPLSDPVERPTEPIEHLADPDPIAEREDVHTSSETVIHERRDHAGTDVDGHAIVGVTNDEGKLLVLIEAGRGIAILPHGTVEAGDDWATVARQGVEGLTGVSVAIDATVAVRRVTHVVDGSEHTTTHRVVFSGSADGGEIRECKRSADAGDDGWEARWVEALPDGVSPPEGGAGNDLEVFLR